MYSGSSHLKPDAVVYPLEGIEAHEPHEVIFEYDGVPVIYIAQTPQGLNLYYMCNILKDCLVFLVSTISQVDVDILKDEFLEFDLYSSIRSGFLHVLELDIDLKLLSVYKIDFSDIAQNHLPIPRVLPMTTPTFEPEFVTLNLFPVLRDEVAWVNRSAPRDECFMASENAPQSYSYGNNNETREALHTYHAVEMHPAVLSIMEKLNQRGTEYNVCVLNYYKDRFQHLGWHADDSPEQDLQHPIAVISFGAERYLYTKKRGDKGDVPDSGKYLMTQGGLFVMPGGYQDTHLHKIPKHHTECDGRISLTFRKLVR